MTLRVDNVSWAAGGALVLDGISLAPEPGETIGLLGPNGSGKSSLIRLLHGLNRPSTGTVDLNGEDLRTLDRRVIARAVAVVGQHAETDIDICVREVVRLGRIPRRGVFGGDRSADDSAVAAALARTGLTAKADHLWHTLSGGEKQRVQIARALAQEPRDLLLDEPTNHLDIHHQLELLTLVSRLPVTTIMAIHDLNLAAMFCDRVVVLRDGRAIASGRPRDVLTAELIADVYRVHAEIIHDEERDRLTIRYEPSAIPPGRLSTDDEALAAD